MAKSNVTKSIVIEGLTVTDGGFRLDDGRTPAEIHVNEHGIRVRAKGGGWRYLSHVDLYVSANPERGPTATADT